MSKILYILSCPKELFKRYLAEHSLMDSDFDLLSKSQDGLEDISFKNHISYNSPSISPIELSLVKKIRSHHYDKIVFFYNNSLKKGYVKVELLSLLGQARKVEAVLPDLSVINIKFSYWAMRFLKSYIYAVFDILCCFLLICLFLPIAVILNIVLRMFSGKEKSFLFMGIGGKYSASFRVRCQNFSKELAKRGLITKVHDFWNYHKIFIQERESIFLGLYDLRRILNIIFSYFKLITTYRTCNIFYCQKIDYSTFAAYFACLGSGKKYIVDYDDFDKATFNEFFYRIYKLKFLSFNWITKFIAKKAKLCVVASRFLEGKFKEFGVEQILYIPTAVDSSKFIRIMEQ